MTDAAAGWTAEVQQTMKILKPVLEDFTAESPNVKDNGKKVGLF